MSATRIRTRAPLTEWEASQADAFRRTHGLPLDVAKAIPAQRGELYYRPGEFVEVEILYDDGHVAVVRASIHDAAERGLMVEVLA